MPTTIHRSILVGLSLLSALVHTLEEPTKDPFYIVPRNIASYSPGEVIRNRSVSTFINGTTSFQLFYRTTNEQGHADGTVATVWVPDVPSQPPRVLSYQYAEDADNLDCAPSWAWVAGAQSNNSADAMVEGPVVVPYGLSQGAYVVNPDAEGSKSAWLVGHVEGQACLDAIRAAMNFFKLSSKTTEIGMYGYSGGAHTTVWAASLAATYAPELKIVGAAFGGTPVDLRSNYNLLNGSSDAILAGGALYGLANGYPALNRYLTSQHSAEGKNISHLLRSTNFCLNSHSSDFAGFNFSDVYMTNVLAPGTELSKVLARESLLSNVSSLHVPVPKFPRYEYHGNADTTVPYQEEVIYVSQQCARGADIAFITYEGLSHIEAAVAGLPGALDFLTSAYDGTLVKGTCGDALPIVP